VRIVGESVAIYEELGVPTPYFVALSLDQCDGWQIGAFDRRYGWHNVHRGSRRANRQQYMSPEIAIESADARLEMAFRPAFDHLANAFGCSRSQNYNDAGEWVPASPT